MKKLLLTLLFPIMTFGNDYERIKKEYTPQELFYFREVCLFHTENFSLNTISVLTKFDKKNIRVGYGKIESIKIKPFELKKNKTFSDTVYVNEKDLYENSIILSENDSMYYCQMTKTIIKDDVDGFKDSLLLKKVISKINKIIEPKGHKLTFDKTKPDIRICFLDSEQSSKILYKLDDINDYLGGLCFINPNKDTIIRGIIFLNEKYLNNPHSIMDELMHNLGMSAHSFLFSDSFYNRLNCDDTIMSKLDCRILELLYEPEIKFGMTLIEYDSIFKKELNRYRIEKYGNILKNYTKDELKIIKNIMFFKKKYQYKISNHEICVATKGIEEKELEKLKGFIKQINQKVNNLKIYLNENKDTNVCFNNINDSTEIPSFNTRIRDNYSSNKNYRYDLNLKNYMKDTTIWAKNSMLCFLLSSLINPFSLDCTIETPKSVFNQDQNITTLQDFDIKILNFIYSKELSTAITKEQFDSIFLKEELK